MAVRKGFTRITFTVSQSPYNAGETASFPDNVAKRYVERKVARYAPEEGSKSTRGTVEETATDRMVDDTETENKDARERVKAKAKKARQ